MKFKRINFNEIYEEFEIIEKIKLISIKGGRNMPNDIVYGVSPDGFLMEKVGDGDWVITVIRIEEVELIADKPGFVWDNLYNMIFQNANWYSNGFYIGGGSGSGGNGGNGGSNGNNENVNMGPLIASIPANTPLVDAIGLMMSSIGISITGAQASAIALNLENAISFTQTSQMFGLIDIYSNLVELFSDNSTIEQRIEDGLQIGVGIVLTFGTLNPVGIVLGGIILTGWEIYEYRRDNY